MSEEEEGEGEDLGLKYESQFAQVPLQLLLIKLVEEREEEMLEYVLNTRSDLKLDLEQTDTGRRTPLIKSILLPSYPMVKSLIDGGADVNAHQWRPLHHLAHAQRSPEQIDMAKALLAAGAEVNTQQMGGLSALHLSAARNNTHFCRFLMDKGINRELQSVRGQTAFDFAGSPELKDLIKNFGTDDSKKNQRRGRYGFRRPRRRGRARGRS